MIQINNKKIIVAILIALTFCFFTRAADNKKIVLGIASSAAANRDCEFQRYNKSRQFYKDNGIRAALLEQKLVFAARREPNADGFNSEKLLKELKKYHVVMIRARHEGTSHTPAWHEFGPKIAKVLAQYVAEGGGLLLQPVSVRYLNCDDEKFWNLLYKPFALQQLQEGIFDKDNQIEREIKAGAVHTFFHSSNIVDHQLSKGVDSLWFPKTNFYPNSGVPAMKYSSDWTVLVRGEKSAKSYLSFSHENIIRLDKEGTFKSSPPIIAVREFGKGRVACIPVSKIHTGLNYGNPFWPHIVEKKGDESSGRDSDMMRLFANAVKWLGEKAVKNPALGSLPEFQYQAITFPESCEWDSRKFKFKSTKLPYDKPTTGIIGLHSSYSDGTGTVAEYAETAKKAGLSFIVFTDPLELLSEKKLASLKNDCKKVSGPKFYACPGVEYTDGTGIRWISYGEKVAWPKPFKKKGFLYPVWDGKVIKQWGHYRNQCDYYPAAVIDYKQMRASGASPENMWWFNMFIPYAYDRDKLIADNTRDMLFALRDIRYFMPISYTKIKKPADVLLAKKTARTVIPRFKDVYNLLNRRGAGRAYHAARSAQTYVSYGDDVEVRFEAVNSQMERNFRITRGAQRVRITFTAWSKAGIKEVIVHDADYGILRHFYGKKAEKEMSRTFEMVHDRQHWLILEVIDNNGAKAFSHSILVFCYKQGLIRCSDNLNILGSLGFQWHPDRCSMLDAAKQFTQGRSIMIEGWDSSEVDLPRPTARLLNIVKMNGVGSYPQGRERLRTRMDIKLAGHNIQVVDMKIDDKVVRFPSQERAPGASGYIVKPVEENPYYTRVDRLIAPADRTDYFILWNHRRIKEAVKDFDGGYVWHEGEFTFKQNVTLAGPVPLILLNSPFNLKKKIGTTFVVKDSKKGLITTEVTGAKQKINKTGRIAGGGFATRLNTPVGYLAVLIPKDMNFAYKFNMPSGRLTLGIGRKGQKIKAGEVLKYAFLVGTFIDGSTHNAEHLEYISRAFNMGGRTNGYRIRIHTGQLIDATFFLTVKADNNVASFTLGPKKKLGIDLPIKVSGLEDNGCAAVFSTVRKWFRFVPVVNGVAYFQEPIDKRNDIWVGNVFLSKNKDIKITLVADGQMQSKPVFIELHNPTAKKIKTEIFSPKGTPVFGGMRFNVVINPGANIKISRSKWIQN